MASVTLKCHSEYRRFSTTNTLKHKAIQGNEGKLAEESRRKCSYLTFCSIAFAIKSKIYRNNTINHYLILNAELESESLFLLPFAINVTPEPTPHLKLK